MHLYSSNVVAVILYVTDIITLQGHIVLYYISPSTGSWFISSNVTEKTVYHSVLKFPASTNLKWYFESLLPMMAIISLTH
jgi:hypothetical protein